MPYCGHLENGVVVFDEPVDLPDGAKVRVERALGAAEGLEPRISERSARSEDAAWSEASLCSALRGMEDEEFPYTLADLKESFR